MMSASPVWNTRSSSPRFNHRPRRIHDLEGLLRSRARRSYKAARQKRALFLHQFVSSVALNLFHSTTNVTRARSPAHGMLGLHVIFGSN
jgi:hypothetical protein